MMLAVGIARSSAEQMKGGPSAVRAAWYPTVGSVELRDAAARETALGFTLLGENLALWIDATGRPVALADRCAHEGARLSKGICKREGLICRYHGWAHDAEGKALPPGHHYRRPPPSGWGTVPAYWTTERFGRIWVALQEPPALHPVWASAEASNHSMQHSAVLRIDQPAPNAFAAVCTRIRTLRIGETVGIAPFLISATLPEGPGLVLLGATPMDDQATQLWLYAESSAALDKDAFDAVLTI